MMFQDEPVFLALMVRLQELFNREISHEASMDYFRALKQFSLEDVTAAIDRVIKNERRFPAPAVIITEARVVMNDKPEPVALPEPEPTPKPKIDFKSNTTWVGTAYRRIWDISSLL